MEMSSLMLLLASYLRKANHPEETDEQIASGIVEDLTKIADMREVVGDRAVRSSTEKLLPQIRHPADVK